MTVTVSPRKPTLLQKERWKEIQQAKRNGEGAGNPQEHCEEVHPRRQTADTAVCRNCGAINIRYHLGLDEGHFC